MHYIQNIKHPERYQGRKKKKNYFEGWYYKQVHPNLSDSIAFIPGISKDKEDAHAFIQVIYAKLNEITNEMELTMNYFRFAIESFVFYDRPFCIQIEENTFSMSTVKVNLISNTLSVSGDFQFTNLTPIKKTLFSPTIMGLFAYIPNMECNHGIISMNHRVQGSMNINNQSISFHNGKGYIEKDWGRSFPKEYIWLQCNHFEEDATLMMSVANIPFGPFSFRGFIVVWIYDKKEYRFATYNGAKIRKKEIGQSHVFFSFTHRQTTLEIKAAAQKSILLPAPKDGKMNHAIREGLGATVEVTIKRKGNIIASLKGVRAGFEIVNELEKL